MAGGGEERTVLGGEAAPGRCTPIIADIVAAVVSTALRVPQRLDAEHRDTKGCAGGAGVAERGLEQRDHAREHVCGGEDLDEEDDASRKGRDVDVLGADQGEDGRSQRHQVESLDGGVDGA